MLFIILARLLEIEGEDHHLGAGGIDATGKDTAVDIGEFVGMTFVEGVGKAIAELEFGDEFEVGHVEVTAQTQFKHGVVTLELHIVLVLVLEVDHGRDACHDIGAVVVEALGGELQGHGHGDISALHVEGGQAWLRGIVEVVEVAEGEALGAELHLRGESQGQMLAEAHVGQHAYAEPRVPGVGIAEDGACGAVVHELRSYIIELDILHVHAYADAEVQGPQVYVGLVLHLSRLCRNRDDGKKRHGHDDISLHTIE